MSEIARILRELDALRREVRGLSGGRNLSFSAIENGAIADYDADGTLRTIIGRQHDGTHTIRHVDGPEPPQPTAPAVEVDGPVLRVAWDGQFAAGDEPPEDFSRVDVHITAGDRETVAGNLGTREGSAVVVKAQQSGMHTVTLVARSLSGKSSPASEPVEVDVTVVSFSGAIEAVARSANGKNVVTYATVPPTAEDAGTEGDTWWVNESRLRDPDDPASEEYIAIVEQWRHDGTHWVAVELAHEVIASVDLGTATVGYLHGQRIVAATIDTEQLRSTAIDGMVITGATVQTSHEHPKTMMDAGGVHVTDEDGQDLVYLGRQIGVRGADGGTLANISDKGTISGRALNIQEDPVCAGLPLLGTMENWESPSLYAPSGWLDMLPRGVVAYGEQQSLSRWNVTSGEMGVIELQADVSADRMYEITVEPMSFTVNGGQWFDMRIRYTWDGSQPTFSSPTLAQWRRSTYGVSSGTNVLFVIGGTKFFRPGSNHPLRLLVTALSGGTTKIENPGVAVITLKDIGPNVGDTSVRRPENSSNPTPPPSQTKRNYTTEYKATGARNWRGESPLLPDATMIQGTGPTGVIFRSAIQFPSMTADLSGATITSIRAYLYFSHWKDNSGGTADIHLHGDATLTRTFPSTFVHAVSVPGWPKPGGMWVDIPERFWAGFKSGQYRGIGLGKADGGDYGQVPWADAKLEIKYRK